MNVTRNQKSLAAVGFEPTPPRRLVPKTSALDHSAKLPYNRKVESRKQKSGDAGSRTPGLSHAKRALYH